MDEYKLLGVKRGANREEIRKAYLRLARRYHPDRNRRKGASEKFLEIRRAYETLLAALPATRPTVSQHFAAAVSREVSEEHERSISIDLLGIRISIGCRVA